MLVLGARYRTRITSAVKMARYYDTVDRVITIWIMTWYQTVKNFQIQYKALEDKKKNDDPDVPEITKALHVIKWTK